MGGILSTVIPDACGEFKSIIPKLIAVVRDLTGIKRRNAAIFLAKLAKNENNL